VFLSFQGDAIGNGGDERLVLMESFWGLSPDIDGPSAFEAPGCPCLLARRRSRARGTCLTAPRVSSVPT
jgi:hypothetical protein